MLVILKAACTTQSQVRDLRERRLTVRYLQRQKTAFIELPLLNQPIPYQSEFSIPTDLQRYAATATLLIKSEESGGSSGQSGSSIITCGLSGKPIRAYWIARDYRPCGIHAHLTVVEGAATLHASVSEEDALVIVYRHKIALNGDKAILTTENQFQWTENEIPRYHTYSKAARAAFAKARHVNCIEPHYINMT